MKKAPWIILLITLSLLLGGLATAEEQALELPSDLKVIEEKAFYGNTSLINVILPDGIEEIHDQAFAGSSLAEINLPDSLTFIANNAFEGCENVEMTFESTGYAYSWALTNGYISFPESEHPYARYTNEAWTFALPGDVDAMLVSFSEDTMLGSQTTLTVSINDSRAISFSGADLSGMTLALPANQFSLRLKASSATAYGFAITAITALTHDEYEAYLQQHPPFKAKTLTDGTLEITGYFGFGTDIQIPAQLNGTAVTSIGASAFSNSGLTSVQMANGITQICYSAFSRCGDLVNVEFPPSVVHIEDDAFYLCTGLEAIDLPQSLELLGSWAFSECNSLSEVEIPDITEIGNSIFAGCTGLQRVTVLSGAKKLGGYMFSDCTSLEYVELPDGLENMESGTFTNCTALKHIDIPNSITELISCVFDGCTGLEDISISTNVESIGDSVFKGCTSLIEVDIPSNVVEFGYEVFSGCSNLIRVTINNPDMVFHDLDFCDCAAGLTLYGYIGSTAQSYASDNGLNFEALDNAGI